MTWSHLLKILDAAVERIGGPNLPRLPDLPLDTNARPASVLRMIFGATPTDEVGLAVARRPLGFARMFAFLSPFRSGGKPRCLVRPRHRVRSRPIVRPWLSG